MKSRQITFVEVTLTSNFTSVLKEINSEKIYYLSRMGNKRTCYKILVHINENVNKVVRGKTEES